MVNGQGGTGKRSLKIGSNSGLFYQFPCGGGVAKPWDMRTREAPHGRMFVPPQGIHFNDFLARAPRREPGLLEGKQGRAPSLCQAGTKNPASCQGTTYHPGEGTPKGAGDNVNTNTRGQTDRAKTGRPRGGPGGTRKVSGTVAPDGRVRAQK